MNEEMFVMLWCFIVPLMFILYVSLYYINKSIQYVGEQISKRNRYIESKEREEDYERSKAENYYISPQETKRLCEFAHKRQDNPFWAGVKGGIFATTGVIKLKTLGDWAEGFGEEDGDR